MVLFGLVFFAAQARLDHPCNERKCVFLNDFIALGRRIPANHSAYSKPRVFLRSQTSISTAPTFSNESMMP